MRNRPAVGHRDGTGSDDLPRTLALFERLRAFEWNRGAAFSAGMAELDADRYVVAMIGRRDA